jgi:hypothetical protein
VTAEDAGHSHHHDHTHDHTQGAARPTGGDPGVDRERLKILLRNWVEHNDGHRRSYLEWRDRLENEGLPATTAAMEQLADLAAAANSALAQALHELDPHHS